MLFRKGASALLQSQAGQAGQDRVDALDGGRRPLKVVTIALIVMACLTSVAVMAWSGYHSRALELSGASISASNTAHTLANQANSSFKMADTVLVSLVDKVEVEGWSAANMARLRALMMKHMADMPALQGLFIYDENGRWIVNSAGTRFDGRNNSDRAYFQYHKQHPGPGVHVGGPIIGRTSGAWIIPVSRRIDHPDGSFAGVALATIKIDFFRTFYEGLDIGSDGRILMTLDDGTLLLRVPFDTASIGRDTRKDPVFRLRGRDAEIDGATFIRTESRVGDYPARITVLRSKDVALRPWLHSAILSYLALFVLIAGLLLLGRRAVRQIGLRDQLQRDLLTTKALLETANASLSAMAYVDGLTELFNRRYYEQTWEREHRRAFRNRASLAVLMIDVDHFKRYNDRYGHLAGDECLKTVAQAMLRGLRRSGDLAARYGGEEFVVLLPDTDLAGAREVAEKIHASVAAHALRHEASPLGVVTVSIGAYAAVPEQADDPDRAFGAHADAALYRAKEAGRNRTAT
jgi:diguanylate cyclase (GGDEF)-like protein